MAAILVALASCAGLAHAQEAFLQGESLREAIAGKTLSGQRWAEYYKPDGTIHGRVRFLGTQSYIGRWTALEDRICYDYEGTSNDTCSRLRIAGDQVFHHDLDGRLKADGVAKRMNGNTLSAF